MTALTLKFSNCRKRLESATGNAWLNWRPNRITTAQVLPKKYQVADPDAERVRIESDPSRKNCQQRKRKYDEISSYEELDAPSGEMEVSLRTFMEALCWILKEKNYFFPIQNPGPGSPEWAFGSGFTKTPVAGPRFNKSRSATLDNVAINLRIAYLFQLLMKSKVPFPSSALRRGCERRRRKFWRKSYDLQTRTGWLKEGRGVNPLTLSLIKINKIMSNNCGLSFISTGKFVFKKKEKIPHACLLCNSISWARLFFCLQFNVDLLNNGYNISHIPT